MRRSLAAMALLGLALPGAAAARAASQAWATGSVVKLNATAITVRGTVTLAVVTGVGSAKSTLDGTRTLTCDLPARSSALLHGFHVGSHVKITCDDLTLAKIVRV